MATPVKIIPTLHGKTAKTFLARAEELERRSEELRMQGKVPHHASIYTEREEAAYIRMMKKIRNASMTDNEFLSKFTFMELTEEVLAECEHFSCGVSDLDDYFQKDVIGHTRRMVSRSYAFRSNDNPRQIACAFSVSNDSLRITDLSNRKQEVFREDNDLSEKRLKRYPGVLIGRLAVNRDMAHQGIGSSLMNFIKRWLGHGGKTGCRFLIVDARNTSDTLAYYEKNGFVYLFPSEEEESKNTRKDKAIVPQTTRLMYFDFMSLVE